MKKVLFSLFMLGATTAIFAQTNATIPQIQTVSAANLAACVDSSALTGQIVTVKGVVVMDGNLAVNGAGTSVLGNTWIQAGTGGWSGLDIFGGSTSGVDALLAGDSVEITGTVFEFGPTGGPKAETEITTVTAVNVINSGNTVHSTIVNLADINDNAQVNLLGTGEQWEGVYVELQNVTVTAVVPFANGTRVSFNVTDAAGNMINVSDRFKAAKLPAAGGSFVPPAIGTTYCSLRGILMHSPNGCKNYTGRGYELHPFDAADYFVCPGGAYPQISAISNAPLVPTSSQTCNISATITDADGTVTGAKVYYAVGAGTMAYDSIAMTNVGSTYSAIIPAQANGSFVKYYISANDNDGHRTILPNVPNANNNPLAYIVKDAGLDIYDLQYTPFTDGNSIFKDKTVTVTGIVTASAEATNLGYVFIQQEGGLLGWAGIMLTGNAQLALLKVGDKVTVMGDVKESFGMTRMENISSVTINGTGTVTPLEIDPATFSTYSFAGNEAFEGMLITLKNTAAAPNNKLYVINTNADAPSNFGEYRIGKDGLLPDNGCRVIAGRQTSSTYSSLNVSYVNDAQWASTDGVMNVTPIVVAYNDCMNTVTGIMYYGFGNMKLLPRNDADFFNYGCTVGIDNALSAKTQIAAFPSPAADVLNVNYTFPQEVAAQITLTDMLGRTVATQTVKGTKGETTINLQNVPTGTYILRVNSEEGQVFSSKVSVVK